jgi:hypothetical protein
LNEPLLRGRNILLISEQQHIKEKVLMDIIRMIVSNNGLLISELFLLAKKRVVNLCLRKIFDGMYIPVKKLTVQMILSKLSKNLERFL